MLASGLWVAGGRPSTELMFLQCGRMVSRHSTCQEGL